MRFHRAFPLMMMSFVLSGCATAADSKQSSIPSEHSSPSDASQSLPSESGGSESEFSSLPSETPSSEPSSIPSETPSSEPLEEVDKLEALSSLRGRFQEAISCPEDLGLTDLSKVGVNKGKLENETLYKVPEGGHIYRVEDYGISVENANNSRQLNDLIDSIKGEQGDKIILFGKGTYHFNSTINLLSCQDIYLIGDDTRWVLTSWTTYIAASETKNLHVHGFRFDMDPSPTVAGTVKSYSYDADGNCDVVLLLPEEFDCSASAYASWDPKSSSHYTGSFMECIRDPKTGKLSPDRNKNLFYNSTTSSSNFGMLAMSYKPASRELTVKLNKKFPYCSLQNPTIGGWVSVAYTMYDFFGFSLNNCQDTYMEHVETFVAAGMGLRANSGKNLYLNHVNFVQDPNSSRIMTCTADIIHTCALEGDLRITNCILESSHDDALNIKSFYGKVTSIVKSTREITIGQTQSECVIKFEEGDTIDFFDPNTMGLIDTYKVVSCSVSGSNYTVTVDRRPNNLSEGLSVGNDSKSTHMYLHNCLIQNKRNRGILLQTRYSEISSCTFHNVIMGAIQVLSVGDIFREAIAPKEVVLKDNKIINCLGGDVSIFAYGTSGKSVPGSIRDVTVENNFFYNGDSNAIYSRSVTGLNAKNNLMNYPSLEDRTLIRLVQTQDSSVSGNLVYVDGQYSNNTMCSEDGESSGNIIADNRIEGGH